jgi:hypothetical protein
VIDDSRRVQRAPSIVATQQCSAFSRGIDDTVLEQGRRALVDHGADIGFGTAELEDRAPVSGRRRNVLRRCAQDRTRR